MHQLILVVDRPLRTYTLYITYTPYYRTPRLYLSGYLSPSEPLSPHLMMEDIVGDYADKTVTLEDFPFFDAGVKMASIHPCKHASVMKVLLDRADAALKIRLEKMRRGNKVQVEGGKVESGMEGLVDQLNAAQLNERRGMAAGAAAAGGGDEWEVLQHEGGGAEEDEVAIRVDQYLVVFLKVRKRSSNSLRRVANVLLTVHGFSDTRHRTRFHDGSLVTTSRGVHGRLELSLGHGVTYISGKALVIYQTKDSSSVPSQSKPTGTLSFVSW